MGMRVVAVQLEILDSVTKHIGRLPEDPKAWPRLRFARNLDACLFLVVEVEVHIAPEPNDFPRLIPALLRQKMGQERKVGNIPTKTQVGIG